ncbi:MAG: hypothetical protein SVZ03_04375 [Spirochaetota bacterium]|nr:hypothetical protein [Spirochaetota bacterium]
MFGKRILIITIIGVFLLFVNCRSKCASIERTEGFFNGILRVYVRVNIIDEEIGDIKEYLLARGRMRAMYLIEGYLRINLDDSEEMGVAMKRASDVVRGVRGICHECDSEYCSAFIDFNTKALEEVIELNKDHKQDNIRE